ncbi:hypothetical protein NDU88_006232 [Pleurodeles waltl]|uniref:Protein KTI12 homolog n=1 Tax=Pleurodeles waltl TaxID=8319 RepID=A0AAV7TX82_PLEWA|nr:hypothetical protein NDU88_006232 [Pleurodeles waltl]
MPGTTLDLVTTAGRSHTDNRNRLPQFECYITWPELTRILSMAELHKARRQFISYTKMHPNENISQLANMFVQYLNKSIH